MISVAIPSRGRSDPSRGWTLGHGYSRWSLPQRRPRLYWQAVDRV